MEPEEGGDQTDCGWDGGGLLQPAPLYRLVISTLAEDRFFRGRSAIVAFPSPLSSPVMGLLSVMPSVMYLFSFMLEPCDAGAEWPDVEGGADPVEDDSSAEGPSGSRGEDGGKEDNEAVSAG